MGKGLLGGREWGCEKQHTSVHPTADASPTAAFGQRTLGVARDRHVASVTGTSSWLSGPPPHRLSGPVAADCCRTLRRCQCQWALAVQAGLREPSFHGVDAKAFSRPCGFGRIRFRGIGERQCCLCVIECVSSSHRQQSTPLCSGGVPWPGEGRGGGRIPEPSPGNSEPL